MIDEALDPSEVLWSYNPPVDIVLPGAEPRFGGASAFLRPGRRLVERHSVDRRRVRQLAHGQEAVTEAAHQLGLLDLSFLFGLSS